MIYDAEAMQSEVLDFLDRMKERVEAGDVTGIVGWTTEVTEGGWGVKTFSIGRFNVKELVYGAAEMTHDLLHGNLD